MATSSDDRLSSPAALRNRGAIVDVLRKVLPTTGKVLEIASGSREHIVHFAASLPELTWILSGPSEGARASPQRRVTRWEHEHILEAMQARLDANPDAMRVRRQTVEHPFGTLKARMGATHFLMKTKPRVSTEMALHVLAYNLTRVLNIVGSRNLQVAIAT